MKIDCISTKKNHVNYMLVFSPDELKASGTSLQENIEKIVKTSCKEVLAQLGLMAADAPTIKLSDEDLKAEVMVTCFPVIKETHYKGITLSENERKLPENEQEELAIDKVIEAADFDLPKFMLENEVGPLVSGIRQQLKYDLMAQGKLMHIFSEEMAERLKELENSAIRQVKLELVLEAIIGKEQLEVTHEELGEEAKAISIRQSIPLEEIQSFFGEDLAMLGRDILNKKAKALVLANAVTR